MSESFFAFCMLDPWRQPEPAEADSSKHVTSQLNVTESAEPAHSRSKLLAAVWRPRRTASLQHLYIHSRTCVTPLPSHLATATMIPGIPIVRLAAALLPHTLYRR